MSGWDDVEMALTGLLDRRWYTNHGPLARQLEAECAEAAEIRHAVAVTNPTIALMMLADAFALSGEIIVSALAPARCVQALDWAGLTPRFCDIDPETLGLAPSEVARARGPQTSALLASGRADLLACPPGLRVFGEGLSGEIDPVLLDLPAWGDDAGSACILTDDDGLAARLRNIRSSYGAGRAVPVVRTANGRLSEAQAAMALLVPAAQRIRQREMLVSDGRCAVPHGREWLLIARDEADYADLLDALRQSGRASPPMRLDPRAAHCDEAARIAALSMVLETDSLPVPVG